jgi:hypothetical protein
MNRTRALFTFLVFILFCVTGAYAQQTGALTGTVKDGTGAVIPNVNVTATNSGTQQARTVSSNSAGDYSIPFLTPGIYEVRAQGTGFKASVHPNIEIQVGGVQRVDFNMELGAVSEQVEVTSAEPLLSTESVALGSVVGTKQIVQLPLNGRDYLSLVQLSPNVVTEAASTAASSYQGGVRSAESISIAGQRLEFNHYTLDGVENTDPNFNSYIIHPSVDALQEFKVQTGVYSAEFGRGAAQINATTLSGTNKYHFVAFEFVRSSIFDADQWRQIGRKDPFHRNDAGFTLDGPLTIPKLFNGKDKLFFMSNFEILRDRLTEQVTSSVPTLAERQGDFSAPGLPAIYDPLTRVYTSNTTGTATQFSYNGVANVIPTNRISPAALALLNYEPLPNVVGASGYNYARQAAVPTDETQFNQRIDWTQNQRSSWFGRFGWETDLGTNAPANLTDTSYSNNVAHQVVIGNTFVVSPTMVNESRFAWSQFNNDLVGYFANNTNVQSTLNIQGLVAPSPVAYGLPIVGLGGGVTGYGGVTPWVTRDDLFQWIDNFSIVKGKHSMRVGGAIGRDRYNETGTLKATGEFDFDGNSTNNPGLPGSGYIFADFMAGYPSQSYRVAQLANAQLRRTTYVSYFQDDWKLTEKITINMGVRYENTRPWHDKYNQLINAQVFGTGVTTGQNPGGDRFTTPVSDLVPGTPSPILTRPCCGDFYNGMDFHYAQGQPTQIGDQYLGKSLVNPNNENFGPRIGINYSPNGSWTFRAGYGIFYLQDIGNAVFDMSRNLGGKDGSTIATNDRNASTSLSTPFAYETASAACPGYVGLCLVAPQIQANWVNNRTPYAEQYLLNIQRQLGKNTVVEVGYMGNQGHHIGRDFIVNQAVPKSGPSDTSSIAARRPFPSFGPIQEAANFTNTNYHSLTGKVTQRPTHGLEYTIAFTWSRALDGGSALRSNSGDTLWPSNSYNLAAEYGPSQFNLPRRLVLSYLYDLPFGSGQAYLTHGFLAPVVGGWRLGGILTLADGTSISATQLGDTAGLGVQSNEPDATAVKPIPQHRTANNFWNSAAFDYTNPDLTYRPGTMSRDVLYTPGTQDWDASLSKDFHIWETHALNFRAEAFNFLNHPNWNQPASSDNRSPSTFGIITSAKTMRQIQFAIKYSF